MDYQNEHYREAMEDLNRRELKKYWEGTPMTKIESIIAEAKVGLPPDPAPELVIGSLAYMVERARWERDKK